MIPDTLMAHTGTLCLQPGRTVQLHIGHDDAFSACPVLYVHVTEQVPKLQ